MNARCEMKIFFQRYGYKISICAAMLGVAAACLAVSSGIKSPGEKIQLQIELKDGYYKFSVPKLYLGNRRNWKSGTISSFGGSFDERTLCPYLVAFDEANSSNLKKMCN